MAKLSATGSLNPNRNICCDDRVESVFDTYDRDGFIYGNDAGGRAEVLKLSEYFDLQSEVWKLFQGHGLGLMAGCGRSAVADKIGCR